MTSRAVLRAVIATVFLSMGVAGAATPASAQIAVEAVRTRDGLTLEFPDAGAWRVKARQVQERRAILRAAGDFAGLNASRSAAAPSATGAALSGTMYVPAVLFGFLDSDTASLPRAAQYDSLYFGLAPPAGRAYSLRQLYREMSDDLLDVQGAALGWVLGDSAAAYYLGACGTSNVIDCGTGRARLHGLWMTALATLDADIDFGQFDNDGPDGIPNSTDDDGYVDVVQFVQPVIGGECRGTGVWAHRWYLSAMGGSPYLTNDPRPGGGVVRIDSYLVGSGVGGAGPGNRSGCGKPGELAGIGTMAHEFGHAIALPDLYDTGGGTEGIGEWGLMGSGGYTSANSPTHLEAWSKERLGWVTVVPLTQGGTLGLSPVVAADTVFLVRPPAGIGNPRGEYFLLENRQPVGSDTANMNTGGSTGPKLGGLLVWHVDSLKLVSSGGVNAGTIHGVALVQADGLAQLDLTSGGNRGDAGDPFPGSKGRTSYSHTTTPSPRRNADGAFAGFVLDSIRQVESGGAMAFRLQFGLPLAVRLSGPGTLSSAPAVPGDTLLPLGQIVTLIGTPSPEAVFDSWSGDTTTANDTLALTMHRPWSVQANFAPRLVVTVPSPGPAVMGAPYSVALTAQGGVGTYGWMLQSGQLPRGLALRPNGAISGVPEETGSFGAAVRVASGTQVVTVPVALTVNAPALTTATVLSTLLGTGASLSDDERRYLDLLGNRNGRYDVGDFHAFVEATGGAATATMMAEVLQRRGDR